MPPMDSTSKFLFDKLEAGYRVSLVYEGETYTGTVVGKNSTSSGTSTLEVNVDVSAGIEYKGFLEYKIDSIAVI